MRKHKKNLFVIVPMVFILFVILVIGVILLSLRKYLPAATSVILHRGDQLKEENGNIHMLLLGVGGGTHDGPDLTDTIIFASLDPKANKVTLVSIPRDLWIDDLHDGTGAKINEAYTEGEDKRTGGGLLLAKSVVTKVINQPIDYSVRVDFNGFIKAVDVIGGIDVNVPRTFDDYLYPITGKEDDTCNHTPEEIQTFTATASAELDNEQFFSCRYKHVHFDAGLLHMDGETALEFVRSRHALGSEGTDFARSARQEKVIAAFRDTLLSTQILLNPTKLSGLYAVVKDSIDTDVTQQEFGPFITLFQKIKNAKITSATIDFGDAQTGRPGLLVNPPISSDFHFASVLLPRLGDGKFWEIQTFVACEIVTGDCPIPSQPPTPTIQ